MKAIRVCGPLAGLAPLAGATAALLLGPASAHATEGGGTSKIVGIETVRAGVMAEPGSLRRLASVGAYEATRTLDGAGNPRAGLSNFKVRFGAVAARLQYVWKDVKLWGADLETRAGYTFYGGTNVSFDVATPGGAVHRAGSAHGGGDAFLAPLTLGWRNDRLHQIAGIEVYVPTGRFDRSRLANLSRGYTSIAPVWRFSWFAVPALELSGNLVLLYNLKNGDTQYKSGRELSFDYGIGHALGAGWQGGVSGYVYKQLSDDTLNGARFGDGNRGRVNAIGPFVRYSPGKEWGVTLKWQIEGQTRNRAEGNRFFLQVARAVV